MKVFLFRKRHLMLALGALLTAAIFAAVNLPVAVTTSASTRQLPIYCVDRDDNVVAISFDAAWGNEDTQQLIDIMAKYNVKTTFFVVGDWVEKYPESVKALHDAGHEIMNHSDHHDHYNSLSTEEIIADINACNDKIEAITGVRPTLIRCPYGEYDDHVIAAIRSIGMEPIQWDVEALAAVGKPWAATNSCSKKVKTDAVDDPGVYQNTLRDFSFLLGLYWCAETFGSEENHSSKYRPIAESLQCCPGTCQHDSNSHYTSTFFITTCSIV